ncbi:MAG: hypothetical protein KBT01_05185 [Clostridiales bacterium]|nr:hypothetical protein [Candidatus Blautia equi]
MTFHINLFKTRRYKLCLLLFLLCFLADSLLLAYTSTFAWLPFIPFIVFYRTMEKDENMENLIRTASRYMYRFSLVLTCVMAVLIL